MGFGPWEFESPLRHQPLLVTSYFQAQEYVRAHCVRPLFIHAESEHGRKITAPYSVPYSATGTSPSSSMRAKGVFIATASPKR